jgi:hypothetical protein
MSIQAFWQQIVDNFINDDVIGVELDDHLTTVDFALSQEHEPAMDPLLGAYLTQQSLGQSGNVLRGHVVHVLPSRGWYRVSLDGLRGTVPCAWGADASYGVAGPRDAGTITPDAEVLVYYDSNDKKGYIISVIPEMTEDGNLNFEDYILQGSGVGVKQTSYYADYLRMLNDEGGVIDFAGHRPADSTAFDWGKTTETGAGLHLDPYYAYVRASELCGLWLHYHDDHARLVGQGLDIWSGAHSESYRNDEGEAISYRGETPYPHEMLGAFEFGTPVHRENTDEEVHFEKAEGKYEPTEDDQKPFHRYEEYGGYLGQARIRQVTLPPQDTSSQALNTFGAADSQILPGVFREQISLDGSYAIESAKSIIIAKRNLIPIPVRRRPSDDYTTDCDSVENANYKFAGIHGEAEAHKVGDIANNEVGKNKLFLTVAAVMDLHSYTFNWKGLHPFHYHKKDYKVPEEREHPLKTITACPPFSDLATGTWFSPREATELTVDHRYGKVKYFSGMSHLSFIEDGQMVQQGGWGEEIRFVAGSVQISCPGNVLLQPGKSIIGLAGDDAIIRARNSIDLTTSAKDIRLKAEQNLMALSGNASSGGAMLFENRSPTVKHDYPEDGGEAIQGSGIVMRVPNAQFTTMAKEVYIRTGGGGEGSSGGGTGDCTIASGPIVLDAARGDEDIRMIGKDHYRFIKNKAQDGFGIEEVEVVNHYDRTRTVLCTRLDTDGEIRVRNGGVRAHSNFVSSDGHVFTSSGGHTSRLRNRDVEREYINGVKDLCDDYVEDQQKDYDENVKEEYYAEDKIGNKEMQKKISFSLREEEEYCTKDFELPQTYWQILENGCGGGTNWEETEVEYQCTKSMMPWPGKAKWKDEQTLLKLPASKLTMYDLENNYSKDRGEVYEDPKYGSFEKAIPNSSYKVIDC